MLAIEVEFLTGRYIATVSDGRSEPEWPPHPSRLFSALVAAWHEANGTDSERSALLWLEQQIAAPEISASAASRRSTPTVYVPVNDAETGKPPANRTSLEYYALADVLPERRVRQPRRFPSVTPVKPRVYFIWHDATLHPETREALGTLCLRVANLGHSSSLVRVTLTNTVPASSYLPRADGKHALRTPTPGQWDALKAAFSVHKGVRPRSLPTGYTSYTEVDPEKPEVIYPQGIFSSQWLVLRLDRRFTLRAALKLTATLRAALMELYQKRFGDLPEWLSGHDTENAPSKQAHIAFAPLADVGHRHARGHVLGLAIIFPATLASDAHRWIRELCAKLTELRWSTEHFGLPTDGSAVELAVRDPERESLKARTWTCAARAWATVTPFVFDRHPGRDLFGKTAEEVVRLACERQGLPPPLHVAVTPVSPLLAVPLAAEFPSRSLAGKQRRQHAHVGLTFSEPVVGPLLLGAGRYYGYGLFRPIPRALESEA
jgi:CRISPR-associated protein Csb2